MPTDAIARSHRRPTLRDERPAALAAREVAQASAPDARAAPPPAALLRGPAVALTPPGFPKPVQAAGPSPWWPKPGDERVVEINGHSFDLEPTRVAGESVHGDVDGPFDYNGAYEIHKNRAATATDPAHLALLVAISGDSFIAVELRVAINIRGTSAGARAKVRIENRLVPPGDYRRVQEREVALSVDGNVCRLEFTLNNPENAAEPMPITIEWSTR